MDGKLEELKETKEMIEEAEAISALDTHEINAYVAEEKALIFSLRTAGELDEANQRYEHLLEAANNHKEFLDERSLSTIAELESLYQTNIAQQIRKESLPIGSYDELADIIAHKEVEMGKDTPEEERIKIIGDTMNKYWLEHQSPEDVKTR